MKNFIISTCCIYILSVFSAQGAVSNEGRDTATENKKVSAKCHVSLIDGSEVIIFNRVQLDKLNNLARKVEGKRVSTPKSLDKIKVYRAFQCVLADDDFTNSKAQAIDEKTAR